jgi:hypothetical protein
VETGNFPEKAVKLRGRVVNRFGVVKGPWHARVVRAVATGKFERAVWGAMKKRLQPPGLPAVPEWGAADPLVLIVVS